MQHREIYTIAIRLQHACSRYHFTISIWFHFVGLLFECPPSKTKQKTMKTTKQKNSLGFNSPFDVHRDIDRTKYLLLIHIVNFINIATTDDYLLFRLYFHFFSSSTERRNVICNILISKSALGKVGDHIIAAWQNVMMCLERNSEWR